MKTALVLVTAGVCALTAAVLSYAFGASHLGTAAGTAALLVTAAGLALMNQASRAIAQQQRNETNSVSIL
jgi:hypothetical protein